MTDPIVPRHLSLPKSGTAIAARRSLNYQDTYICPICRHGQIAGITLMDAFACNFCRHIFTANLRDQSILVEDSSQPMAWRWNGRNWLAANHLDLDLTFLVWLVGAVLVVVPPSLIWLSASLFPPLPGSRWAWFPTVWAVLALCLHGIGIAWLLAEHYQIPFYVTCKVRLQNLLGQR